MTGAEFLDEFNKLTFFGQQQIDILMVSNDYLWEIKTDISKNCSGYIDKPLTSTKLLAQMQNIRSKRYNMP